MKRLLIALGIVMVILVVVVAAFFGYVAMTGGRLDKESKAYADAAGLAIISSWSEQELLGRASSELQKAANPADVERLFRWFRTLGRIHKNEGAQGEAVISVTPQSGRVVFGRYVAKPFLMPTKRISKLAWLNTVNSGNLHDLM